MTTPHEFWELHFDGSLRETRQRVATYGYVLTGPLGITYTGQGVVCRGRLASSTAAEFGALEAGLREALKRNVRGRLACKGDSLYVVRTVANPIRHCRRRALRPYLDRVRALLRSLQCDWQLYWVPRKDNKAHDLSRLRSPPGPQTPPPPPPEPPPQWLLDAEEHLRSINRQNDV